MCSIVLELSALNPDFLFVHSSPDRSGFEHYSFYRYQQKGSKRCIAARERGKKKPEFRSQ
jgi:hypothetical protein